VSSFNSSYPTSTLTTAATITNSSILNKLYNDSLYTSFDFVQFNFAGLGNPNTFTSTNTFNSFFPTSTLTTAAPYTNDSILNKRLMDSIYPNYGFVNIYYAGLANNNVFTSTNTFNSFFPTSTLTTTAAYTNDSILNKRLMDSIYPNYGFVNIYYAGLANNNVFTSTNSFNNFFPTSTLTTSASYNNQSIVNKAVNDSLYPSYGYAAANYARLASDDTFTANVTFNILPKSTPTPTVASELTNKGYVDSAISGGTTTTSTKLKVSTAPSGTLYPTLTAGVSASENIYQDGGLSFNSLTNELITTTFTGSLNGIALNSTNAGVSADKIDRSLNVVAAGHNGGYGALRCSVDTTIFGDGIRIDSLLNDLTVSGNASVGSSLSIGSKLLCGSDLVCAGSIKCSGPITIQQSSAISQIDYLRVTGTLLVGKQYIGQQYMDAGFIHLSNTYGFPLPIKSITDLTSAFSSSYTPTTGINLAILLGNGLGVGYILLRPRYSFEFLGTDGTQLQYVDNEYGNDTIYVQILFDNPTSVFPSILNMYYRNIRI